MPRKKMELDVIEMKRMYVDELMTLEEIADIFDVHYTTVANRLKEIKVKLRSSRKAGCPRKEVDIEKVKELYFEKNMTLSEIAKKYRMHERTLSIRLRENGIERKSPSEKKRKYKIDFDYVKEELKKKKKVAEIARNIGVDHDLLHYHIKKNNLKNG